MNPAVQHRETADLARDQQRHRHPQRRVGAFELVDGVTAYAVVDVTEDGADEEEHDDRREQKNQPSSQQRDLGVDAQLPVHCPAESS
jgi:hypothetical protein